eukprot:jgi/Mesen1/8154/ME000438S07259
MRQLFALKYCCHFKGIRVDQESTSSVLSRWRDCPQADEKVSRSRSRRKSRNRSSTSWSQQSAAARVAMGKQGPCNHCGIATTPLWRNGPPEKPVLCNACGSRWRTRGTLHNYMPLHAGGLGLGSAGGRNKAVKKVKPPPTANAASKAPPPSSKPSKSKSGAGTAPSLKRKQPSVQVAALDVDHIAKEIYDDDDEANLTGGVDDARGGGGYAYAQARGGGSEYASAGAHYAHAGYSSANASADDDDGLAPSPETGFFGGGARHGEGGRGYYNDSRRRGDGEEEEDWEGEEGTEDDEGGEEEDEEGSDEYGTGTAGAFLERTGGSSGGERAGKARASFAAVPSRKRSTTGRSRGAPGGGDADDGAHSPLGSELEGLDDLLPFHAGSSSPVLDLGFGGLMVRTPSADALDLIGAPGGHPAVMMSKARRRMLASANASARMLPGGSGGGGMHKVRSAGTLRAPDGRFARAGAGGGGGDGRMSKSWAEGGRGPLAARHGGGNRVLLGNFPYSKRNALSSCQSPLIFLELKDVASERTFQECLTEDEQAQLLPLLPSVDTAGGQKSLAEMFGSPQWERTMRGFQRLLSAGMFDASEMGPGGDVWELYQELLDPSNLAIAQSGWAERACQLREKAKKQLAAGQPLRAGYQRERTPPGGTRAGRAAVKPPFAQMGGKTLARGSHAVKGEQRGRGEEEEPSYSSGSDVSDLFRTASDDTAGTQATSSEGRATGSTSSSGKVAGGSGGVRARTATRRTGDSWRGSQEVEGRLCHPGPAGRALPPPSKVSPGGGSSTKLSGVSQTDSANGSLPGSGSGSASPRGAAGAVAGTEAGIGTSLGPDLFHTGMGAELLGTGGYGSGEALLDSSFLGGSLYGSSSVNDAANLFLDLPPIPPLDALPDGGFGASPLASSDGLTAARGPAAVLSATTSVPRMDSGSLIVNNNYNMFNDPLWDSLIWDSSCGGGGGGGGGGGSSVPDLSLSGPAPH